MRLSAAGIVMCALVFYGGRANALVPVDVLVQAGHVGRPMSCKPLRVKHCNLGARYGRQRERDWTPVVAQAVVVRLRRAGYTVRYRPADWSGHDRARAAVFLHFDGDVKPCGSGASVGFPRSTGMAFVHDWEAYYRPRFPFRFAGENISTNERNYYAFRKVTTPGRAILIEFGEMTCSAQERWMEPRLRELGNDVARFLASELQS